MTIDATTRDALAQIDHALAVQDATPTADADWQPGDPLHHRGLYARPMFQLLDDGAWAWARCKDCDVSWDGPDPCWMCGKAPTRSSGGTVTTGPGVATLTINLDATPFMAAMRELASVFERDLADSVRRLSTAMRDGAISDELVRLTLGGRGPDRPELVIRSPFSAGGFIPLTQIRPEDLQG